MPYITNYNHHTKPTAGATGGSVRNRVSSSSSDTLVKTSDEMKDVDTLVTHNLSLQKMVSNLQSQLVEISSERDRLRTELTAIRRRSFR